MRVIVLAAILLAAAPAVAAAPASHSRHVAPQPQPMVNVTPPSFDAMLSVMDKLFPAQPDPDPARLALARTAVAPMWPDEAYGKMMSSFMGKMFDQAMQLKTSDLNQATGTPSKPISASASDDMSLHDQIVADDPYFDRRTAAVRAVVADEMAKVSAVIDPRMREGLARSMARRFDAQQLTDVNAFFATPSGHALASQYMQLFVDPDTLRSLFQSMPEIMKLMPEMMDRMKAASDQFPSPPKRQHTTKR
jgi:hypothetical protein